MNTLNHYTFIDLHFDVTYMFSTDEALLEAMEKEIMEKVNGCETLFEENPLLKKKYSLHIAKQGLGYKIGYFLVERCLQQKWELFNASNPLGGSPQFHLRKTVILH
jgi:hypothetical protein